MILLIYYLTITVTVIAITITDIVIGLIISANILIAILVNIL